MERWFVKREELVLGPYSEEELQGYVARGKVTALDLVSQDGKVGWTTIYHVPQFRDVATRDAATRLVAPPPEPESQTPPAASVRAWYVARGSQVAGPLDLDALRAALIQGKLKLDDKVCEVGGTAWGAVNGIAEIADLLPPVPLSGGPSVSPSSTSPSMAPVPSSPSQNHLADQHISAGKEAHSWWRRVGGGLVSAAIVFMVLVGLSPAPETPSTTPAPTVVEGESSPAPGSTTPAVLTPPQSRRDQPMENVVTWRDFTLPNMDDFLDVVAWRGFRVCARSPLHHCRLRVGRVERFRYTLQTVEYTVFPETIEPPTSCETQMQEAERACANDASRLPPSCAQRFGVFGTNDPFEVLDQRDIYLRENQVVFECDEGYVRR